MSEPLILISTFRVKKGKLEQLKRHYKKILEIVGTPPESALAMDLQSERSLGLKPVHIAGFTRSSAG